MLSQVVDGSSWLDVDSVEVGTVEYSHLPRSRDTLDQHPSARSSSALTAQKMLFPTVAAEPARRSPPSAVALDVGQFQTVRWATALQMCSLSAQAETPGGMEIVLATVSSEESACLRSNVESWRLGVSARRHRSEEKL